MKNFLRVIDFFGQRFNLYIGYKPKFYTCFGGIMTLLSFISYILIFIIIGNDDLKRKNPFSNTSTVPPNGYKNIKFGEEKIYLPWRIIDYDENPINITNVIYPRIFYFTVQPDNITGELITKYNLVDYKLCNETSMKNLGEEYIIDIPLETLYCIDMENLKVGGSWNADFLNFIRFDLYMCKDGIDYNESNFECTSYDNLENIYGGGESIFFELLYPNVQFQPTNIEVPILIVYKTHYYIINKYTNKLDRLYLQEYVFEDEKGWIINNPYNISYWGVNSIDGESYIQHEKDVLRFASNSKCYTLNIYFELGIVFFTRKYKKLYEILGELFPIMNVFYFIFENIAKKINEAYCSKKLNEYIMGIDHDKEKRNLISLKNHNIIKNKLQSDSPKNKHNSLFLFKNKTQFMKDIQSNKLFTNSFEDASNIIYNPNNVNGNLNLHLKNISNRNSVKQNIRKTKISKNTSDKFPLKYYFYGMIYMKLNYTKNNKKLFFCFTHNFFKSYSYFRRIIDITSYIRISKEFELYKTTLFKNESNNKIHDSIIDKISGKSNLYNLGNYKY